MKKRLPKLPEFEEPEEIKLIEPSEPPQEELVEEIMVPEEEIVEPEKIIVPEISSEEEAIEPIIELSYQTQEPPELPGMVLCKWTDATEEHRIMVRIGEKTLFFTFSAPDFTCYLPEALAESYHNSEHRIKKA